MYLSAQLVEGGADVLERLCTRLQRALCVLAQIWLEDGEGDGPHETAHLVHNLLGVVLVRCFSTYS